MKNYLRVGIASLVMAFSWAHAVPNESEQKTAWAAAEKAAVMGPTSINISQQAQINVPQGYAFIPKKQANDMMISMGNGSDANLQGLLISTADGRDDMYTIDYIKDGYINDSDAKDIDPDSILSDYKEGTEEGNKERIAKGFPPIEVGGWAQKPSYDATLHRLTWALTLKDKNQTNASQEDTVNYETRLLGRDGYMSITWITSASALNTPLKAEADQLTSQVVYVDGKKYQDHSSGDKVAEYGLAALITGVVAKKAGLFAALGILLAKFSKLILVALFGLFPFLKRFFKKKDSTVDSTSTSTESNPFESKIPTIDTTHTIEHHDNKPSDPPSAS